MMTTCTVCQQAIETGQGWHCKVCPDYDFCNACYSKGISHPHGLRNDPSIAEPDARNTKADARSLIRELLVHASGCHSVRCQYPRCLLVKCLFRHGRLCKVRASGGCFSCKRMWSLLQTHTRNCRESRCIVPRCRDFRVVFSKLHRCSSSQIQEVELPYDKTESR